MEVIALSEKYKKKAVAILVRAFINDGFVRWLYPDQDIYLEAMPQLSEVFIDDAISNNSGWIVKDAAVACWTPPDGETCRERRLKIHQRYLSKSRQEALHHFFESCAPYYPKEAHWYLGLLGVEPGLQGLGIGSALLQDRLKKISGIKASLETTGQINRYFYEHNGFDVTGTVQSANRKNTFVMVHS